jgi:hypothetical protein
MTAPQYQTYLQLREKDTQAPLRPGSNPFSLYGQADEYLEARVQPEDQRHIIPDKPGEFPSFEIMARPDGSAVLLTGEDSVLFARHYMQPALQQRDEAIARELDGQSGGAAPNWNCWVTDIFDFPETPAAAPAGKAQAKVSASLKEAHQAAVANYLAYIEREKPSFKPFQDQPNPLLSWWRACQKSF